MGSCWPQIAVKLNFPRTPNISPNAISPPFLSLVRCPVQFMVSNSSTSWRISVSTSMPQHPLSKQLPPRAHPYYSRSARKELHMVYGLVFNRAWLLKSALFHMEFVSSSRQNLWIPCNPWAWHKIFANDDCFYILHLIHHGPLSLPHSHQASISRLYWIKVQITQIVRPWRYLLISMATK